MPRGDAYQRGFADGRMAVLRFLAVSIDCYPNEPSEVTMEMLTPGEIDMSTVVSELQRLAEKLEGSRRRRRSTAGAAPDAIAESEVTQ